jgi:hypothetical protein
MAISDKPWNGAASNYSSTDAYCSACLIDENESGQDKVQSKCHLPVKTPDGAISRNGVHAAAARLMQTKTSPANKKAAARKLRGLYRQLKETPPESIQNMGS